MASKQSSGGSIPVVLRVKRKRTEEPAEALSESVVSSSLGPDV